MVDADCGTGFTDTGVVKALKSFNLGQSGYR